jgi:hypothetical protein
MASSRQWTAASPFGANSYVALSGTSDRSLVLCATNTKIFGTAGRLFLGTWSGVTHTRTWVEVGPLSGGIFFNNNWQNNCVGVSATTGSTQIAVAYGGRAWISRDTGATWAEIRPDGVDAAHNWTSAKVSADGNTVILCHRDAAGKVYVGTWGGASWTWYDRTPDANRAWLVVYCSADATKMLASWYNGRIWASYNSGLSWTEAENRPEGNANKYWKNLSISADGNWAFCCAAAGSMAGNAYVAKLTLGAWVWGNTHGSKTWNGCFMNADGTKIIAGSGIDNPTTASHWGQAWQGVRIGTTQNLADWTWTDTRACGSEWNSFQSCFSDSTGIEFTLGVVSTQVLETNTIRLGWGPLIASPDTPPDAITGGWRALASDRTGQHLIVGDNEGTTGLFRSADFGATCTQIHASTAWISAACDIDATHVVACQAKFGGGVWSTGNLYVGIWNGASYDWTTLRTGITWQVCAISSDGHTLFASDRCTHSGYAGTLYRYDWNGATYTETALNVGVWGSNQYVCDISLSGDGTKFIAALAWYSSTPTQYVSGWYTGGSWSYKVTTPRIWHTALSRDGNHALILAADGVRKGTWSPGVDHFWTWSDPVLPQGYSNCKALAMDEDGSYSVWAGSRVFTSSAWPTFTEETPDGYWDPSWAAVAVNKDGVNILIDQEAAQTSYPVTHNLWWRGIPYIAPVIGVDLAGTTSQASGVGFSVHVTTNVGVPDLNYTTEVAGLCEWRHNGVAIVAGGRITQTKVVTGVNEITWTLTYDYTVDGDAGSYTFHAENDGGLANSSATAFVLTPPVCSSSPATPIVDCGTSITLSVSAPAGMTSPTYAWTRFQGGIWVSVGIDSPSLSLVDPTGTDYGYYRCVATKAGAGSIAFALSPWVWLKPTVTVQPNAGGLTHIVRCLADPESATVELTVDGSGEPGTTYEWHHVNLSTPPVDTVVGTGATLVLDANDFVFANAGYYYCIVSEPVL